MVKGQGQGGDQYAVAMRGGLAAITEVQLRLLLADPATSRQIGQQEPTPLSLSDFAAIPKLDDLAPARRRATGDHAAAGRRRHRRGVRGGPRRRGRRRGAGAGAARRTSPPRWPPGSVPRRARCWPTTCASRPGRGAVVEAVLGARARPAGRCRWSPTWAAGTRCRAPTCWTRSASAGSRRYGVPASLVALLPAGPALDPEAARAPGRRELTGRCRMNRYPQVLRRGLPRLDAGRYRRRRTYVSAGRRGRCPRWTVTRGNQSQGNGVTFEWPRHRQTPTVMEATAKKFEAVNDSLQSMLTRLMSRARGAADARGRVPVGARSRRSSRRGPRTSRRSSGRSPRPRPRSAPPASSTARPTPRRPAGSPPPTAASTCRSESSGEG